MSFVKIDDETIKFAVDIKTTYKLAADIDETKILKLSKLNSITSVISNLVFFAEEKWKISSDRGGSGNTANIGSIDYIEDLLNGNGVFKNLGEHVFDDYWINQGVLQVAKPNSTTEYKKLTKLTEYLKYRNMDIALINQPKKKKKTKK